MANQTHLLKPQFHLQPQIRMICPNDPSVEIDLATEEKAIRAEHQALTDNINARDQDPNVVTSHWLQKGSVLMAHNFFGELVASQSTKKSEALGKWSLNGGRLDR